MPTFLEGKILGRGLNRLLEEFLARLLSWLVGDLVDLSLDCAAGLSNVIDLSLSLVHSPSTGVGGGYLSEKSSPSARSEHTGAFRKYGLDNWVE